MARSYVESILDAAAMASSQDTLGDMLNQIPGLLVEQQRYKEEQQREDEKYADEKAFRNLQYNDMIDSRNFSEDVAMVNILTDLEGDEAVAFGDNVTYKTDKGRNLGNAVQKSKKITVTNNNDINTKFKNLSDNFANLTVEEAEIQLSEFRLELDSKGIKRDTSNFDKRLAVKKNREFANNVLDIVEFENEDELRDIIKDSNNPTQIATFMIDRLDKDKLDSIENKKDKNKLMIDLGNVISSLRNSDAPESVIKRYENKLALLSASSIEGEPVESDGTLTEAEMEAFKSKGQSGIITVPNNDENRIEKNIEINLDTGEFRYVDEPSVDETPITESRKEKAKRLRENKRNAKTKKEFDKADKELKEFLSKPDEGIDRTYAEEQAMRTREEQTRLVPSSFNI